MSYRELALFASGIYRVNLILQMILKTLELLFALLVVLRMKKYHATERIKTGKTTGFTREVVAWIVLITSVTTLSLFIVIYDYFS